MNTVSSPAAAMMPTVLLLEPATPPRLIGPDRREALHGGDATRHLERMALAAAPAHALMARAGLSVARLAQALQPHARCIWVACGPGNNGGDGLVAATHLHRWASARGGSPRVVVTHGRRDAQDLPADAAHALDAARRAGVAFAEHPPGDFDLAIDALLGIGAARAVQGRLGEWLGLLRQTPQTVLCVDLPSGLHGDTGVLAPLEGPGAGAAPSPAPGPRHTLSLLTLKPGLFTASGRDVAGQVWFDGLGFSPPATEPVTAWLAGHANDPAGKADMAHASHKGSFGDVMVIGGQGISVAGAGMTGAALLAARAALHGGAGRVFVGLLGEEDGPSWDPACPELMFRSPQRLLEARALQQACVVCGCGGGDGVAAVLPRLLSGAPRLVLDADALNAISNDTALRTLLRQRRHRGWTTVLTPHPLEAARLLGTDTAAVMADRLRAAQALADELGAVCVLKGSGTVLAAPDAVPLINPTGNAALATAGTGDVLAGLIGSTLARSHPPASSETLQRVAAAVFQHGRWADLWPAGESLSAGALAARLRPAG